MASSTEEKAFPALIQECRQKDPLAAWFVLGDDKIRLAGDSAQLALKILPKYDCSQSSARLSTGEELMQVYVKASHLGKLLTGLLFSENRKVDIFKYASGKYVLSESATPGNYETVEHYMDDTDVTEMPKPVVAILTEPSPGLRRFQVGLFIVNKVTKTVSLCSFEDNSEFDTLDAVLESLSPAECSVSENSKDEGKVVKILTQQNLSVIKAPGKSTSNLNSVMKDLEKFVDFTTCDRGRLEKDERLALLASALLNSSLATSAASQFKIVRFDFSLLMKVSSSTLEGLHIFGKTSLFSTLNHTRTAGGERLLRSWLRQPLTSHEQIQTRLDIVDTLVQGQNCRKSLHDNFLRKIPDFEKICQKCNGKRLTLMDLYKAYCGIREIGNIGRLLSAECGEEKVVESELILPLQENLEPVKKFVELIEKTLDFTAIENGEYRVNATFDDTLTAIKKEIDKTKEKIQSQSSTVAKKLGMNEKSLKLECNSMHGFFFRVTLKDERGLRQKKGLNFFDSTKSGVKFRTEELDRLNNAYLENSKKFELQQQYIIDEVIEICQGYCKHFLTLSYKISELDCLVSLATAAEQAPLPYTKPKLNTDGIIELKKARHPILEQKGSINFIPNSASISKNAENFIIITGPNLGGKSTYMRSVALCVYMTQIGSFVPCAEANVCPVDNILVRIGASDSQYYGVSTFMAEMLDASRILRHSTANSLIIIDEIGRGTSTYDGFGLAWAISHHIASEIKAATLFATHFHEMTKLADELPNVKNVFCDAIAENHQLTLLYSIGPGVSKKSFGIEVAQMAGFPESVLKDARTILEAAERNTASSEDDKQILEMKTLLKAYTGEGSGKRKAEIEEEAAAVMKKVKVEKMNQS